MPGEFAAGHVAIPVHQRGTAAGLPEPPDVGWPDEENHGDQKCHSAGGNEPDKILLH